MAVANHRAEIDRLYRLEYGEPVEVAIRFIGITAGSVLMQAYTHWTMVWWWLAGFLAAHLVHFAFLKSRGPQVSLAELRLGAALFLPILAAFLWMPSYMISSPDLAVALSGAALFGCILTFLVRRAEVIPVVVLGEVGVVAANILWLLVTVVPRFPEPMARAGVSVSTLVLLFCFAQAVRVSRRLRLETAAAQRSLQAEKMAAIGQLAGGVAHDFNNNLTAILGHLELIELIDDPAERRASLADAMAAAQQAARTVKQLLAFARKERLELAPQDARGVIEDLVTQTRRLIPASVTVELSCPEEHLLFRADRGQLMAALVNLVANAVDAMPEGGRLTFSASAGVRGAALTLADGGLLAPGRYVELAVEDTGTGIPPEILGKVVEPFFTTKPTGKGTGMGLPMVLGITREFGGGLGIASSPRGTRVTVYLPQLG